MQWARLAGNGRLAGRDDDGGEVSAAVDPSAGGASAGACSGTISLQLTVWEQRV
jgi:hypothetical protein